MTYERIKIIKGRKYRYLVRGERINGKVKQKVVKYLGAVEPVKERRKHRAGRKPSIFARAPTQEEKLVLEKKSRSALAFERDRALILLHSFERKDVKQICERVLREQRMVRRVIKQFNKAGLKVFERKKTKGRKPKFTKEQRAKVLQAVLTEPKKLGLPFVTWSLSKLKAYLVESGIVDSISIEHVRNILHSQNVKLRKSRCWHYSNDPEFSKKTFDR